MRVIGGRARMLRRARGFAPAPLALPCGFADGPPASVLRHGRRAEGELSASSGTAPPSSRSTRASLADAATFADYRANLARYAALFGVIDVRPRPLACDLHPEYLSASLPKASAFRGSGSSTMPRMPPPDRRTSGFERAVLASSSTGWPRRDGAFWGGELLAIRRQSAPARPPCAARHAGRRARRASPGAWVLPPSRGLGASTRRPLSSAPCRGPRRWHLFSQNRLRRKKRPAPVDVDAAAALLGVSMRQAYEGEAAMALEALVEGARVLPGRLQARCGTT